MTPYQMMVYLVDESRPTIDDALTRRYGRHTVQAGSLEEATEIARQIQSRRAGRSGIGVGA